VSRKSGFRDKILDKAEDVADPGTRLCIGSLENVHISLLANKFYRRDLICPAVHHMS
jgi:hypothetical protein